MWAQFFHGRGSLAFPAELSDLRISTLQQLLDRRFEVSVSLALTVPVAMSIEVPRRLVRGLNESRPVCYWYSTFGRCDKGKKCYVGVILGEF